MPESSKMQEGVFCCYYFFSAYNNGQAEDVYAKQNAFISVFNSARNSAPKDLINESWGSSHFSKQMLKPLMTI